MIRPRFNHLGDTVPAPQTPEPITGMKYLAWGIGALLLYVAFSQARGR